MHKYKTAARQVAWYNDLDEQGENYNPFRKYRTRHFQPVATLSSATQSDEEVHKGKEAVLPDLGAIHANQSPVRIPTEDLEDRRRLEEARADGFRRRREAEEARKRLDGYTVHAKEQPQLTGILWSIFSEVWQNLADMGKSTTSHAHSVPQDAPLLEVPSRPIKFMVIEYAKQEDDIRGTRDQ